ncbi:MAG TPA: Clp protease N-terminal domain-containing protein, partial [Polyangia bacterium]
MLSTELERAIRQALEDATRRNHEFSGLEHLLLALLDDEKSADVIRHCGGSLPRLRDKLEKFLTKEVEAVDPADDDFGEPEEEEDDDLDEEDSEAQDKARKPSRDRRAQPTLGFARVVQRAINHVVGAGRSEASGPNVLVAMFSEPESHAVFFLAEEGISRLDVVSYLSHGVSKLLPAKPGAGPGPGGIPPAAGEDGGNETAADPL